MTVLDEHGMMMNANTRLTRTIGIGHPRNNRTDFLPHIHPVNQEMFRQAIQQCRDTGQPASLELYLKNGCYHPMKWEIFAFDPEQSGRRFFFCAGFKLAERERIKMFSHLGSSHYRHIIEGLHEGILIQDTNGEVISASQRAAEIFDTTLQRFYELRHVRSLWNKDWNVTGANGKRIPFDETPFMRAVKTGECCDAIVRVELKSGEFRNICFKSQPLFEPEGNAVTAVVSSLKDMTQEEMLSKQLRQKEVLFNAFMENTPGLAWLLDEEARLIAASQAFYRHFNISETTAQGQKVKELVPPQVYDTLFEKHMRALEKGDRLNLVEKVNWVDGSSFIFHISIFPITGESGRKMIGGHAVNMAGDYNAEKQLKETNERLMLLSRASTNAIWEWDMQTGYIFRNDALMDMIGYPQEDTRGLSWWLRRIHPEDRNRVSDTVREVTDAGQQSWEGSYRFKCADGKYKHMLDKGFVVYENGLPVRMIGSLQDVTDMRKLESDLIREKMSRHREITETAIRVQEKERTRIGHELHDNVNQILSTTKLFVDMLHPKSDEEKKIKDKSVNYLLMAIEEIRKLSRELVTPQLQENGLVKSIKVLVDDLAVSTRIRFRFTHDSEVDCLEYGKQITTFRIIQEQLKNTVTHSQATQVEILLQRKEEDLVLVIRDNGRGFNVKQSSKGIGLANIHKRARYYNGEVSLQSAPGEGCTLEVRMPFANTNPKGPQDAEALPETIAE